VDEQSGLLAPALPAVKKIHVWRERRASFGELVMQDSSPFRWLEERGPACQLIALIDDATSRVWARFTEQRHHGRELANLGGMVATLRASAGPLHDKNSIFRTAGSAAVSEQLRGEAGARSQFGRALGELRIEWNRATKSAGERRIERLFETLQDRLVKEMRLAGNASLEACESLFGNALSFPSGKSDSRWYRAIHAMPIDGWGETSPGRNPECARGRKVADDHTVSWDGNRWGVPREEVCAGLTGSLGGNRTASGRLALAALPQSLSAPAPCPEPAPRAVSLPAYGSRTYRTSSIKDPKRVFLRSTHGGHFIWQKTGHFYFALTVRGNSRQQILKVFGIPGWPCYTKKP